jgi:hypothetical protein
MLNQWPKRRSKHDWGGRVEEEANFCEAKFEPESCEWNSTEIFALATTSSKKVAS